MAPVLLVDRYPEGPLRSFLVGMGGLWARVPAGRSSFFDDLNKRFIFCLYPHYTPQGFAPVKIGPSIAMS